MRKLTVPLLFCAAFVGCDGAASNKAVEQPSAVAPGELVAPVSPPDSTNPTTGEDVGIPTPAGALGVGKVSE